MQIFVFRSVCIKLVDLRMNLCMKLRPLTASNNRDHARNLSSRMLVIQFNRSHVNIGRATTSQSLLLLLARASYIMVLFVTHIPFVVNHIINTTPPERLQQYQKAALSLRQEFGDSCLKPYLR